MFIESADTISVQRISAKNNGTDGAVLTNGDGNRNVTVYGRSTSVYSDFSNNGQDGLVILTNGSVVLRNVWAESNRERGISAGTEASPVGGRLTITNGLVIGNGGIGLQAYTSNAISMLKTQALENGGDGVYLDNTSGSGTVTVKGDSFFNVNGGDGLFVSSNNHLSVSSVTAEGNGADGIDLSSSAGKITLSKAYVKYSGENGFNISGNNRINLYYLSGFSNGSGSDGDGLQVTASLTTLLFCKNASFVANEAAGLK